MIPPRQCDSLGARARRRSDQHSKNAKRARRCRPPRRRIARRHRRESREYAMLPCDTSPQAAPLVAQECEVLVSCEPSFKSKLISILIMSQPKTVVVAVGRPGDTATTEHAIAITSPGDRILFVSAVKSNSGAPHPSAEEAVCQISQHVCASQSSLRCQTGLFHSGGRTERLDVADALCIAAQVADASTLCLGFRGIGAASRTMFGSVSDQCSRTCPVSVAVVKQRSEPSA
jgi:hypothetical protein